MTGNDIAMAVKEIAATIGVASSEILPHYTNYYVSTSLAFILLGLVFCVIGFYVFKRLSDEEEQITGILIGAGVVFIGAWVFFYYIGDLFGAQGMAIHQLIMDVRGK